MTEIGVFHVIFAKFLPTKFFRQSKVSEMVNNDLPQHFWENQIDSTNKWGVIGCQSWKRRKKFWRSQ